MCPLPRNGALSTHINCDSDHAFMFQVLPSKKQNELNRSENSPSVHALPKHPRFNISTKQDLLLPDSRIRALEPPLFSAIVHGLLFY